MQRPDFFFLVEQRDLTRRDLCACACRLKLLKPKLPAKVQATGVAVERGVGREHGSYQAAVLDRVGFDLNHSRIAFERADKVCRNGPQKAAHAAITRMKEMFARLVALRVPTPECANEGCSNVVDCILCFHHGVEHCHECSSDHGHDHEAITRENKFQGKRLLSRSLARLLQALRSTLRSALRSGLHHVRAVRARVM